MAWYKVLRWTGPDNDTVAHLPSYTGSAKEQIYSTGYTIEELIKIEKAFEEAPEAETREEYIFNGLVAVFNVLDEIHEVNNIECQVSILK